MTDARIFLAALADGTLARMALFAVRRWLRQRRLARRSVFEIVADYRENEYALALYERSAAEHEQKVAEAREQLEEARGRYIAAGARRYRNVRPFAAVARKRR